MVIKTEEWRGRLRAIQEAAHWIVASLLCTELHCMGPVQLSEDMGGGGHVWPVSFQDGQWKVSALLAQKDL